MRNLQGYIRYLKVTRHTELTSYKLVKVLRKHCMYLCMPKKIYTTFYDHYSERLHISLMKYSIKEQWKFQFFLLLVFAKRPQQPVLRTCELTNIFLTFIAIFVTAILWRFTYLLITYISRYLKDTQHSELQIC